MLCSYALVLGYAKMSTMLPDLEEDENENAPFTTQGADHCTSQEPWF